MTRGFLAPAGAGAWGAWAGALVLASGCGCCSSAALRSWGPSSTSMLAFDASSGLQSSLPDLDLMQGDLAAGLPPRLSAA